MFMIIVVMATASGLAAGLFDLDPSVTAEKVWSDRALCSAVLEAQLLKHPAPNNAGLACILVPDHVSDQYRDAEPGDAYNKML
jgi:hypothetical protein|tara:strand:- start:3173 stop:3421 length:249 start_codon:yes stop_codon:yes gene_type:complete